MKPAMKPAMWPGSGRWSLMALIAMASGLSCASQGPGAPQDSLQAREDDTAPQAPARWPRQVRAGATTLTMYQPQLDAWDGARLQARHLAPYVVAQVAGAVLAAALIYVIASGKAGFDVQAGFAANGYGEHSPGGYSLGAAFVCELVMSFMFVLVVLGATHTRAPVGFAGIAIGLALALVHLISIPVTNTSVNPARSTGPALFVGGWAMAQLWLFWLAPLLGGALAGVL